jgi:aspartate aminotransferase
MAGSEDVHQGVTASRVGRIRPSPSSMAAARAKALKAEGRDIVDLTVGEPDFDTPAHVRLAARQAMERGETRYTPVNGTPALRAAIARKFQRQTGIDYAQNQITLGGGGKQVIFTAFLASVDAGDEVVIPAPYWVSYPDMVLACDGKPVIVACPEADGFKLTAPALEAAITPRTRWLVINSPGNPSSGRWPKCCCAIARSRCWPTTSITRSCSTAAKRRAW